MIDSRFHEASLMMHPKSHFRQMTQSVTLKEMIAMKEVTRVGVVSSRPAAVPGAKPYCQTSDCAVGVELLHFARTIRATGSPQAVRPRPRRSSQMPIRSGSSIGKPGRRPEGAFVGRMVAAPCVRLCANRCNVNGAKKTLVQVCEEEDPR